MTDILETQPRIHSRSRITEELALKFILPKVKKMRLRVLQEIHDHEKGLTGSEIVKNIDGYIVSVRPRLTELNEFGLIRNLEDKRKNARGMFELVWKITTMGKQVIESEANEQN